MVTSLTVSAVWSGPLKHSLAEMEEEKKEALSHFSVSLFLSFFLASLVQQRCQMRRPYCNFGHLENGEYNLSIKMH